MTQAKHMYGKAKTDATKESFQRKLADMRSILQTWKKQGYRDDKFWPKSLREFREWEEPERQIFSWTSPSVTSKANSKYSDLVEAYWRLQSRVEPYVRDPSGDTRAKRIMAKLAEENARLLSEVMQLRSALVRIDPDNHILNSVPFP